VQFVTEGAAVQLLDRAAPRRRRGLSALRILRSPEGDALESGLAALVDRVSTAGLALPNHPSPIVPVIFGTELVALEGSELHQRNWSFLKERDGLSVLVTPRDEAELARLVRG
jgi:hypothetical protein